MLALSTFSLRETSNEIYPQNRGRAYRVGGFRISRLSCFDASLWLQAAELEAGIVQVHGLHRSCELGPRGWHRSAPWGRDTAHRAISGAMDMVTALVVAAGTMMTIVAVAVATDRMTAVAVVTAAVVETVAAGRNQVQC